MQTGPRLVQGALFCHPTCAPCGWWAVPPTRAEGEWGDGVASVRLPTLLPFTLALQGLRGLGVGPPRHLHQQQEAGARHLVAMLGAALPPGAAWGSEEVEEEA